MYGIKPSGKTIEQVPQSCIYAFYTSLPLITFELACCMVLIFYKLSAYVIAIV
jgi:hypothetical protein